MVVMNISGGVANIGDIVIACPARNVQGGFTVATLVGFENVAGAEEKPYFIPVLKFDNGLTQPVVSQRINGVGCRWYKTV